MKKKLVLLLLSSVLVLSTVACGADEPSSVSEESATQSELSDVPSKKETERDLPESDYKDTGAGTFSIQTPSGDSADGSVPVLFVSDEILIQIGFTAESMDGSHLSYIYVDGMEVAKEQLGEMSQGSIDLSEESLEEGTHTVEVVQYLTDEPDGDIITYKSCQYEVKSA